MANIQNELNIIRDATYGREVRDSICEALDKINSESSEGGGSGGLTAAAVVSVAAGAEMAVTSAVIEQEEQ